MEPGGSTSIRETDRPNYRSRLVAKEFKRKTTGDFFAAMPPLNALKMLVALAGTSYVPNNKGEMVGRSRGFLSFVDVKRAPRHGRYMWSSLPRLGKD